MKVTISIQLDEMNIPYDFTGFVIDRRCSDVIMLAYQKRFGGVNPKWRRHTDFQSVAQWEYGWEKGYVTVE